MKGFGRRQDLKACPFCGSWDVELLMSSLPPMPPELIPGNKLKAFLVKCSMCGAGVKTFSRYRRSAIYAWNHRSLPDAELPPGHPRRKD